MQETVFGIKNYLQLTHRIQVQAVRNVDLTVKKRRIEILGIVGESGCGKTVMCRERRKLQH